MNRVKKAEDFSKEVRKLKKKQYGDAFKRVYFRRPRTLRQGKKPLYPRLSQHHLSKTDHYSILRYPLNTESSQKCVERHNTLVFIVAVGANKYQIRDAIEKMYKVKVSEVRTLVTPRGQKKAFVKLDKKNSAVEIIDKMGL